MYKDSSYKEDKWKEVVEILHLNKEDVIKKWKSLRDTYFQHKNIKSKSGDGLSQSKPKWKFCDIMSFIDIMLLKQRYVPIYLIVYHIYNIQTCNRQLCMILIRSIQEKSYKNVNLCFNILVLCLLLLMRGRKMKVMMKGRNKFLTPWTPT